MGSLAPYIKVLEEINKLKPVGVVVNLKQKPITLYEIPVSLESDTDVKRSSILVAISEDLKRIYILRVKNLLYHSPIATPTSLRVRKEVLKETLSPSETMEHIGAVRAAITELIDMAEIQNSGIKLVGPKSVPLPGTLVYNPPTIVAQAMLGKQEIPVHIGTLVDTNIDVTIDLQNLSRHCLIVGTTGTGKSWLRGVLLERLYDLGVPQLIFDPLRDYVKAVEELNGVNLRYGKNFLPRLDALGPSMFRAMLRDVLTPLQLAIAVRAFKRFRVEARRSGKPLNPRKIINYIYAVGKEMKAMRETMDNAAARVEALLDELGYPEEQKGIERYFQSTNGEANLFPNWKELINEKKLVNIDLLDISDLALQVTVASTLSEILELRKKGEIPPLIVSFDETHRIAPREKNPPPSAMIVRNIIRFGRHYGIGIIAITQFPDSIDTELIRLPATRFIFAIDSDQLGAIRGILRDLPEELKDYLPRLERGTAFLAGTSDIIRHTLYVRITAKRRTTHGGETPKFKVSKEVDRK